MRIELSNRTMDIGAGDLIKTQHGYRLIVGGNVSYGVVNWFAIEPETMHIKSRLRNSLAELLDGYKISEVIKGKDLVIANKPEVRENEEVIEVEKAEIEEIDVDHEEEIYDEE